MYDQIRAQYDKLQAQQKASNDPIFKTAAGTVLNELDSQMTKLRDQYTAGQGTVDAYTQAINAVEHTEIG